MGIEPGRIGRQKHIRFYQLDEIPNPCTSPGWSWWSQQVRHLAWSSCITYWNFGWRSYRMSATYRWLVVKNSHGLYTWWISVHLNSMLTIAFTYLQWYSWCVFMKWKDQFITMTGSSLWPTEPRHPPSLFVKPGVLNVVVGSDNVGLRHGISERIVDWHSVQPPCRADQFSAVFRIWASSAGMDQKQSNKSNKAAKQNKAIEFHRIL